MYDNLSQYSCYIKVRLHMLLVCLFLNMLALARIRGKVPSYKIEGLSQEPAMHSYSILSTQ